MKKSLLLGMIVLALVLSLIFGCKKTRPASSLKVGSNTDVLFQVSYVENVGISVTPGDPQLVLSRITALEPAPSRSGTAMITSNDGRQAAFELGYGTLLFSIALEARDESGGTFHCETKTPVPLIGELPFVCSPL